MYAASGNPENYDYLAAKGIDVRGKIVLVRYSVPYSYRGFKALTAERRGAAGILIYSDPAEDGITKGPVYPDGPWGTRAISSLAVFRYRLSRAGRSADAWLVVGKGRAAYREGRSGLAAEDRQRAALGARRPRAAGDDGRRRGTSRMAGRAGRQGTASVPAPQSTCG